jgi:hypothetical protein
VNSRLLSNVSKGCSVRQNLRRGSDVNSRLLLHVSKSYSVRQNLRRGSDVNSRLLSNVSKGCSVRHNWLQDSRPQGNRLLSHVSKSYSVRQNLRRGSDVNSRLLSNVSISNSARQLRKQDVLQMQHAKPELGSSNRSASSRECFRNRQRQHNVQMTQHVCDRFNSKKPLCVRQAKQIGHVLLRQSDKPVNALRSKQHSCVRSVKRNSNNGEQRVPVRLLGLLTYHSLVL